eukprot:4191491-Pyramimonas_sp.AAC.1
MSKCNLAVDALDDRRLAHHFREASLVPSRGVQTRPRTWYSELVGGHLELVHRVVGVADDA